MAGTSARVASNGATRRQSLLDEFFTVNKFLIRYTERLAKILKDDRFTQYAATFFQRHDSDLERMENTIREVRARLAVAHEAAQEKEPK
jgi:hypothetical protein